MRITHHTLSKPSGACAGELNGIEFLEGLISGLIVGFGFVLGWIADFSGANGNDWRLRFAAGLNWLRT